jgi:tricorn protease
MNKRVWSLWLVCLLVLALVATGHFAPAAAQRTAVQETKLMRFPDISRDLVVFVYAEDLWTVPRAGGQARRLTAHPGDELYPKFSPDGKWIAFTGEYDGNADVYVIPAEGGEPRRLTYHPGTDMVLGWTPDGKKILFRSNRYSALPNFTQLFLVSPEGGMPEQLPVPRASLASLSPDGTKVAFNPTSQEFRTWKRYRGGWYNYIGILDLKNNTYEELPRTKTLDQFPMWHGNSIYFISDREGTMNLYRYDLGSKRTTKLSDYKEYDIKWPSLGSDAIVYENGGLLYAYDVGGGKTSKISVTVSSDLLAARASFKDATPLIRTHNLSPSGVRAVFEARGEIFTTPAEHGSSRNLTATPGVHELNAVWSPDGKWIAYLSDRSGEYEIYFQPQKGGEEKRITSDGDCYRYGPTWSPDSKKLLYWDKRLRLWYVDTEEKKPVQVDTGEYGTIDDASWSPDSKWLAYSKQAGSPLSSIFLYSLDQKKVLRVTDGFYNDSNPVFDQNGKYLYFLSQRFFFPSGDTFDNRFAYFHTAGIFAVTLKADEASPFGPRSDEEKEAEEKKPAEGEKPATADKPAAPPAAVAQARQEAGGQARQEAGGQARQEAGGQAPAKAEEKKAEAKPEAKPIQVDVEGIGQRIVQVPVPPGSYGQLQAVKEKLFYMSVPFEAMQAGAPGPPAARGTLFVFDVKSRKAEPLLQGIFDYALDKEGKKVLYHGMNVYGIVDAIPGKAKVGDGRLDTSGLVTSVDSREEWKQMFREAWRIERDFYYDPAMGGKDWAAIGKRYEALLPYVAHRSDLNYILGELIAELNTSHTYVGGGDMPARPRVSVGLLGVDFVADGGFYRFKKIYQGEGWNPDTRGPLAEPGLKVKEGDYLIAVNGKVVRTSENPYAPFQNLAGKVVTLKVNSKPSEEGAWEINVTPSGSEAGLRYVDWVESTRKKVEQATGGRVGYMHVPNTSIQGLISFDKYLVAQSNKDALIVDERYNGGGMIPDFFTEKLQRRLLAFVAPRDTKDIPWPPIGVRGPKVMIVNELAGSGGDCFPWFFKRLKIGPVVGARTWGGLIGIGNSVPLIDGGMVTAPGFGFWSTDNGGEWVVENYGVDPDYPVDQRPDLVVKGQDPQLEKAIELALEALKKEPPVPARPKYPKKN